MYKLFILIFTVNFHALAEFKINSGTYIMPKCFFKISEFDEFIHIQFAHQDQHSMDERSYQDDDFHPDNVLGTNIFYDKKDKTIGFGPDKCGQGRLSKARSYVSGKKWVISCGGVFSPITATLSIISGRNNDLKKFKFVEKLNKKTRGRFSWPWKKRKLFHFSCTGLKRE